MGLGRIIESGSVVTADALSLEGLHSTVPVPETGFWRQWRAFAGPAFLVSVGYMDPGNWGTDLKAGAVYRYELLWVVAAASLMAVALTPSMHAQQGSGKPLPNHLTKRVVGDYVYWSKYGNPAYTAEQIPYGELTHARAATNSTNTTTSV